MAYYSLNLNLYLNEEINMENKTEKPKRVVTRVGDIFCVEFPDNTKGYFQFIAIDRFQLGSPIIRAFRTHYQKDANIDVEDIIKDKIDFYAHTFLRPGLKNGTWTKIGKSKELGVEGLKNIYFGTAKDTLMDESSFKVIDVDPMEHWTIWKYDEERKDIGILPEKYHKCIEPGYVEPFCEIAMRMYKGYYTYTSFENAVIKRYPRPEVFSYLKYMQDNKEFIICFHGNYFDKAVISENGKKTKITRDEAVINHNEIARWKFSDTNWKYNDFITEEEFYKEWDSIK